MNKYMFYMSMLLLIFALTVYNSIIIDKVVDNNDGIVTVYTTNDIYFLEGKTLSNESGSMGQKGFEFKSRAHAIQALEDLTADDSNDAQEDLWSLTNDH